MAARTLIRATTVAEAPDPNSCDPPRLGWARAHLDTWGFVHVRGLFADVAAPIVTDFDAHVHGGDLHSVACQQFMAATPAGVRAGVRTAVADPLAPGSSLGWLAASAPFANLLRALVGDRVRSSGSLASLYSCDVHWHHDGIFRRSPGRQVVVMMYMDVLDEGTGALRVIPGSHRPGPLRDELVAEVMRPTDTPLDRVFGMPARDLPSTVLESVPGDVIVLDVDTVHASFGGGIGRRVLTAGYAEVADERAAPTRRGLGALLSRRRTAR